MARGAGGGIPGNDLGQGSTSPSTFTHVLGVSGAPIGAVGGAADGRRNMGKTSFGSRERVPHAGLRAGRTQWVVNRESERSVWDMLYYSTYT